MSKVVGERLGDVRAYGTGAEIWLARVAANLAAVETLTSTMLSDREQSRMLGYRNVEAAARYVVTRALVRGVLGGRLGLPPRDVQIRVTDLGKPVVSDDLHFNVSHSGDLIVLAVCGSRAVGIDVERRRPVQRVDALTARWLSAPEQREVAALREKGIAESDAFLRVWSVKEARLKAIGVGISGATSADVSRVDAVSLDDLLARNVDGGGYVGAVAFA